MLLEIQCRFSHHLLCIAYKSQLTMGTLLQHRSKIGVHAVLRRFWMKEILVEIHCQVMKMKKLWAGKVQWNGVQNAKIEQSLYRTMNWAADPKQQERTADNCWLMENVISWNRMNFNMTSICYTELLSKLFGLTMCGQTLMENCKKFGACAVIFAVIFCQWSRIYWVDCQKRPYMGSSQC
jgi:hypothetical protein